MSRTLLDPARAYDESRNFADSSSTITFTADALIAFISGSDEEEMTEYLNNKVFSSPNGIELKGSAVSISSNSEWILRRVGCWQTGMRLDVETTNPGRFSTVSFSSSEGCLNGMTAECCMNHCVDHEDCTGVTWYSNATCITYDAMRDDGVLGDPPSLVPDNEFHDSQIGLQITASRLKACRHCDILNYKVQGNQISDTSSLSSFSSCSARCKGSVDCRAWNEDSVTDSCVLYDTVTKIVPQDDSMTNFGFISAGLVSQETCSDDESLPIPCELPVSVYSTCSDDSHTFTSLLPHGSTCIPDCEEGYSSSIQNFTCHQGELVSFPITEEARCDPNPCTLPVESGGECTDGTVSSGAFCEVRCLDTQLRPNVTRFECFAGTLIANEAVHQSLVASSPAGSFECNRPCNVAVARCLEGTLLCSSTNHFHRSLYSKGS